MTMINDMENILKMAATVEYLTIHRTIKESRMAYERYKDTRHQSEQRRYSDALAVVSADNRSESLPSPFTAFCEAPSNDELLS